MVLNDLNSMHSQRLVFRLDERLEKWKKHSDVFLQTASFDVMGFVGMPGLL